MFDWEEEIPKVKEKIKTLERFLFENLDPQVARQVLRYSNLKGSHKTKASFKYRPQKSIAKKSPLRKESILVESDIDEEEVGECPTFRFIPTQIQLGKMLVSAAFPRPE